MQFMLKELFEHYLARLLCKSIDENYEHSSKFQFECSDPNKAMSLYSSFCCYEGQNSSIQIDETPIKYITTKQGHQVLIMLHREGEQTIDTYNEDFIASVRDKINNFKNTSLLVIHNSSLDSISTSFQKLNAIGQIFTPDSIKLELQKLIVNHDYPILMDILLSHRENKIIEENLSIFSYKNLYDSIINNTVNFTNENLFRDSRLLEVTDKKMIIQDIKNNTELYDIIDKSVNDYSDSNAELEEKLEEIGFGEDFIHTHFCDRPNFAKWKELEFRQITDEIDKNRHCSLDVENIKYNDKILTTYKHGARTGIKYKKISIVIEAESRDIKLRICFSKSRVPLKKEDIKISGDYKDKQINIETSNYQSSSILIASFLFEDAPKFLKIKLKRTLSKENFQFNILLVKKDTFNFEQYFEKVTINIENSKGRISLENISEPVCISNKNSVEHTVSETNELIDFLTIGKLNLQPLLENTENAVVIFKSNDIQLPVYVTGNVTLESIKLPSILDEQRCASIFDEVRIPKYNDNTKRAIVGGKEESLSVDAQILCHLEHQIVNNEILTWQDREDHPPELLHELDSFYPTVTLAYRKMFAWLKDNGTILSITNWTKDLRNLVHDVVCAVLKALKEIPVGSLNAQQKKLLEIGMYKGTINKLDGEFEWLTPYHPLCLSYALELAEKLSEFNDQSLGHINPITLNKLTPAGLLPILVNEKGEYSFTEVNAYNKLWLKIVPQKQNSLSYVQELVCEKIKDFTSCFDMLFKQNEDAPLILNSIHNQDNKFIFRGIIDYLEENKNRAKNIHINVYDDDLYYTFFDQFSESKDIKSLRDIINPNSNKYEVTDEIIALVRQKVTYSKFKKVDEYSYAHLSFFKNNEKVIVNTRRTLDVKTGIACQGLISGEASYLENNNYCTGFGLRNLNIDNDLIQLAEKYNELMIPYKNKNSSYLERIVPVLIVDDKFKEKLASSYDNSIWTCIIDPKVTLDFFNDPNTILIHYSDHYTNSSSYDAITVSSRVSLYKSLLQKGSDELLNSFNAISGKWLLEIIKATGKKSSDATEKQIKEKKGIISAYKFIASLLLKSKIKWVPLPVAELLRVTGSLGMKVKGNDFSARLHNKQKGAMCDDILFVGFGDNNLYLMPLEVKNREKGNDFTKAVEQAKQLEKFMKELLTPRTFKGQLFRSLFIQHIISQIERFQLYNVFPENYFQPIISNKEFYQQGNYFISEINNYPSGFALALCNNSESAKIKVELEQSSNILLIELPLGLNEYLLNNSITNLSIKLTDETKYPELRQYVLTNYNSNPIEINKLPIAIEATAIKKIYTDIEDAKKIKTDTNQILTPQPIEYSRVLLGKTTDTYEDIYWEYGNEKLANRHLIVFGRSGQGKTYCIQAILMELAKNNFKSLVIDYTNGFLADQLDSEFKNFIQPTSHFLAKHPLGLSPFRKQKHNYGGTILEEQDHIIATRIASVFNQVYSSIGEQQFATLANTIEDGLKLLGQNYDFDKLYNDLIKQGKYGELLANKLSTVIKSNLFDMSKNQGWENIFINNQSSTTIIQMALLSRDIMQLATEFILWDLYAYACSYGNKNKPLPIVLDEVQNLDQKLESPLGKMLTEGRKYGISLILATQTLSALKSEAQDRLFQAAHKLFFAPAETEIMSYAKLLERAVPGTEKKNWLKELANLQKGECISVGLYKDHYGKMLTSARTIKVTDLKSRFT